MRLIYTFEMQMRSGISGESTEVAEVFVPVREINFRAHDDAGDVLLWAEFLDLVVDDLDGLERLDRRDGVDEDEAMDGGSVLRREDGRLVLRKIIDSLARSVLSRDEHLARRRKERAMAKREEGGGEGG